MKRYGMVGTLKTVCSLVLGAGLAGPAWCGSTITSLSGQVGLSDAPGSLIPGATENDLQAIVFMEQVNLSLASGLTVDASQPGLYASVASLTPGTIAAGTVVSDTYFHADPVVGTGTFFSGSITFDSDILGVIALTSTLNATDSLLASPGVAYSEDSPSRGLELNSPVDEFTISQDLRTLTFNVATGSKVDDLRVITAGDSLPNLNQQESGDAPEPGTLILFPLALFPLALRWQSNRNRNSSR